MRAWDSAVAPVDVGTQRHRLADTHRSELRLLEVRVDPYLIERNDGHQRRSGTDALSALHRTLGDEARDRRRQRGAGVGEIRVTHVRGGVLDVRMLVYRRVIDAGTVGCELLLRAPQ